MIIRKSFKAETAHIVRGAFSSRCDKNIHGHSYLYELELLTKNTTHLDNAGMITDFSFIKKYFNPLFDSFDHASILMKSEKEEIKDCFKNNFERVIIAKWNSTAELQSLFFACISKFLIRYLNENNLWENGERNVEFGAVTVHETTSGYAKSTNYDVCIDEGIDVGIDVDIDNIGLVADNDWIIEQIKFQRSCMLDVEFSEGIMKEWTPEFKKFWHWVQQYKI